MNQIKIGNLAISKKALGLLAIGFFCSGLTLGAFILLSIKTNSNFNIPIFLILNVAIWMPLTSATKKELYEKP